MDELILRVLTGAADDQERRALAEWRRASADHEARYQEMADVWRLTAPSGSTARIPPQPSVSAIIQEAERRRTKALPLVIRRVRSVRVLWWAAAAVFVLTVGLARSRWGRPEMQEYVTTPQQTQTVRLADGSAVRLGPSSRLRVAAADQRRVALQGIAFFAVATDSAHPFEVRTDAGTVRVLGTRFELRSGGDSLRLVVVEGRVMLSGVGGQTEVARGHEGRIVGNAPPRVSEVPDVWALLNWPQGMLMFQATPLADVLSEVSARFGRPFDLRDSSLARRRVTASFEDETLEAIVTTVCAVVGARCTMGDTVKVAR